MVELTAEQRQAVEKHPEGVECHDTSSLRRYVLMDAELHRKAMLALRQQEDLSAIGRGLADDDAGKTMSIEQSQARLLATLRHGHPQQ